MLVLQIHPETMYVHEPDLLPIVKALQAILHDADVSWDVSGFEGTLMTIGGIAERANDLTPTERLVLSNSELLEFASEIRQSIWLKLASRSRLDEPAAQIMLVVFDAGMWEISSGSPSILHAVLDELNQVGIDAAIVDNPNPYRNNM
jgi:hypothetical protein